MRSDPPTASGLTIVGPPGQPAAMGQARRAGSKKRKETVGASTGDAPSPGAPASRTGGGPASVTGVPPSPGATLDQAPQGGSFSVFEAHVPEVTTMGAAGFPSRSQTCRGRRMRSPATENPAA